MPGKSANCCSGICEGKKPKKGKKDKSRCVEHDVFDCPAGADNCANFNDACNGNNGCRCYTTVQGATRCGTYPGGICGICTTDADCAADLGPGAFCAAGSGCGCSSGSAFVCHAPCPN